MARGRYIKPGTAKNETLAKLSPHTRLLFVLLPCHADCQGKLEDRPARIHIEIFPYEPNLPIDEMLNDLHNNDFITRYEAEGQNFIWINKFLKHQSPTTSEKARGSEIPDFDPENKKSTNVITSTTKDRTSSAYTKTQTETKTQTKTKTEKQNPKILDVFEHYKKLFNKKDSYKLNTFRKKLINDALKLHNFDSVIRAIDAMSTDDWDQRPNYNDLKYAIGIINKTDNVEKWASYEPLRASTKTGYQKIGIPGEDKDYGNEINPKL